MSLASMVQFTGTIPAIYLGVPGETNSLPAVIEGTKFNKRKMAKLAIGISAIGSVIGSIVAVVITFTLLTVLISYMTIFFSNSMKFYLYIFVIAFCLLVYNKRNILINLTLCLVGFALSVPGESDISPDFRYTFGIEDLQFGIPLIPVLIGFLIVPTIAKMFSASNPNMFLPSIDIGFCKVVKYFRRKCIPSSLRGSIIGYLCGFVPGVSTVLSTNTSYSFEKKLHPNNPGKLLVASETANNSGQFASMLPLLLIGIPITGSEIVLYSMLVDAGWSPFQFDNISNNADMIFRQIVPWFVVANVIGLLVAWPLAKTVLNVFATSKKYMIVILCIGMLVLNTYLGILDYRVLLYTTCLFVFSCIGLLIKKYETVPLIFMFILGNDIEGVFFRQMLI
jgi:putative tricarboxylic transport membrane protein